MSDLLAPQIDFPHPFIERQSFNFVLENGSFGLAVTLLFGLSRNEDSVNR